MRTKLATDAASSVVDSLNVESAWTLAIGSLRIPGSCKCEPLGIGARTSKIGVPRLPKSGAEVPDAPESVCGST